MSFKTASEMYGSPDGIAAAARELLEQEIQPTPLAPRSKKPVLTDWPNLRLELPDIGRLFANGSNIGMLDGKPSGGLGDVDLDCDEARSLAEFYLPATEAVFGRDSAPRAHRLYRCNPPDFRTVQFADPTVADKDKAMLVELRGTGSQTMAPPSIHPSGEQVEWSSRGEPARVPYDDLLVLVKKVAAGALLARYWSKGERNKAALALAGALLRAGWGEQDVDRFVFQVARAARDEEASARRASVRSTSEKYTKGEAITGQPTCAEIFGEQVWKKAAEWLGLRNTSFRVEESTTKVSTARAWPESLDDAAYHGLAGEYVRMVEPCSEADPVGLLIQFLTGTGNAMGRGVHRYADGARHGLNIFDVLVGETSSGRKGSAWSQVRRGLQPAAPVWADTRIQSGLSSGEGLIWAIRDPIERREPIKEKGKFTGEYQVYEADPGVSDKRLLVYESEFASVLKVASRDGNTLSALIRQAWDSGNLRTLTKNSPAKATGAHISIIGHITRDELLRGLDSTEAANGFANRFLWICVRRSKFLPLGADLPYADIPGSPLFSFFVRLRAAIEWAKEERQLAFSPEAAAAWVRVYPELSAGRPGLLGAVLGRAEAQVLRIALIYAALDQSPSIELVHLRAALAVWEYAENSAIYIFGDRLGDPDADAILSVLRNQPNGMTRTDISNLFARNLSAARIDRALGALLARNLASFTREQTGGRPIERWRATK